VAGKRLLVFSHTAHERNATCKDCHRQTGHAVSAASLQAAGVLAADATTPTIAGMTPSAAPGHTAVMCQQCHDQANMKCSSCHEPPHEARGECSGCHRAGAAFVFVHPEGNNCISCHKAPAKHYGSACLVCHSRDVPFVDTVYTHSAGAHCPTCHKPPAKHYGSGCSYCHSPSVPFAKATFRHPRSANCASCHKAPAKHYGSSCASCHKPLVPFARATFHHPGGTGEHSYRSFACAKCHPNGYSTAYCTCHKGHPPTDD
jgi:hypothetical protein